MTTHSMKPSKPKLVRDNVPLHIRRDGYIPRTRVAGTAEFRQLLREKLVEEVEKYLESNDPEELADIEEVVLALAQLHGLSVKQLDDMRRNKVFTKGTFSRRYVWLGNLPLIETLDVAGDLL